MMELSSALVLQEHHVSTPPLQAIDLESSLIWVQSTLSTEPVRNEVVIEG